MDCFYINLASATKRKIDIVNNFHKNKNPHWNLFRFPAVDAEFVKSANIPGSKSAAEKACFLSHKKVIGSNLDNRKSIFILEDDVIIGSHTCGIIDDVLKGNKNLDWDILFTDVCIPIAGTMFDLIKLRQRLAEKNEITLIDAVTEIDMPYDLVLRKLIFESALKGFSVFPFVTTPSDSSEVSQIQKMDVQATTVVWNMFRKMMWTERNLGDCKASLELIRESLCDEESNAFGILFSAMASINYKIV